MARITLNTFRHQTSSPPNNLNKQPNYLLQGVYPDYSNQTSGSLEVQPSPLAASPKLALVSYLTGNIVHSISSPDTNNILLVTDQLIISAVNGSGTFVTFVGPGGTNNSGGQLAVYNGNNIFANSLDTNLYRGATSTTTINTAFGAVTSSTGKHYMLPFLTFCALVDGDVTLTYGHLIKKITSSFTITTGIDIGTGWGVTGRLMNYNNKYLCIPAGYNGGTTYFNNYMFLWDGIASTYNYSVKIPGKYIDGVVDSNGTPYILVQTSLSNYSVYSLSGLSFKHVFDFNYATSSSTQPMSIFDDSLAILTGNGILVFNIKDNSNYFIDSALYSANSAACVGGTNGTYYVGSGNALSSFSRTGSPYSNISYQSHFLRGAKTTGQINWVRVYYDTAPINNGDKISTTIKVVDENGVSGGLANGTYALSDITPTTTDTPKYTQLDGKGTAFDQLQVVLTTTTASGSAWFPIIRSIVIDYDPL